jgi:hypothetical protein
MYATCLFVEHLTCLKSQYCIVGLNPVISRHGRLSENKLPLQLDGACLRVGLRKMNNLETMLAHRMNQSDMRFDALGADEKVLRVANQDLINYLKHHWNMVGKETSNLELVRKINWLLREEPAEFEVFLSVWVGMWLRKWSQRVKLLLDEQVVSNENKPRTFSASSNVEHLWAHLKGKQKIVELVVSSLVKNGELCATEILAENILKMELGKNTGQVNSLEQMLALLNAALRRAREIAQNTGPLIFVKVDKSYYRSVTH